VPSARPKVEIRRPTSPDDLRAIRLMRRRELLGETAPPADLQARPEDLDPSTIIVVAYSPEGQVVCSVRLMPLEDDASVYEVSRMVTTTEYRGQGIGTVVLAEAEHDAIERGARAFVLDSRDQARAFYARVGYLPTGRNRILDNGDVNYIMFKPVEAV
jgi:predicted GNAT family N-acyltransferase